MKPNECGIIVSVNDLPNGQKYLNITETEITLQNYVSDEIEKFATENNCGVKYVSRIDSKTRLFGPDEFVQHFSK
jgi:hypothetical protein